MSELSPGQDHVQESPVANRNGASRRWWTQKKKMSRVVGFRLRREGPIIKRNEVAPVATNGGLAHLDQRTVIC
jgi:hypothetical protein